MPTGIPRRYAMFDPVHGEVNGNRVRIEPYGYVAVNVKL